MWCACIHLVTHPQSPGTYSSPSWGRKQPGRLNISETPGISSKGFHPSSHSFIPQDTYCASAAALKLSPGFERSVTSWHDIVQTRRQDPQRRRACFPGLSVTYTFPMARTLPGGNTQANCGRLPSAAALSRGAGQDSTGDPGEVHGGADRTLTGKTLKSFAVIASAA